MTAAVTGNLMGITGIARRLVLDGALGEDAARKAMDAASAEKVPLATFIADKKLVPAAALAAAHSLEFGMPLVDPLAIDPSQSAIKLVKEDLLRKHQVLPLHRRGSRLFVGISDPTDLHRPVRQRHGWHHQHPERLPARCVIDCQVDLAFADPVHAGVFFWPTCARHANCHEMKESIFPCQTFAQTVSAKFQGSDPSQAALVILALRGHGHGIDSLDSAWLVPTGQNDA